MSVRVANISALQAIPTSGYDRDVAQSAFVTSVGDYFHFTFGVTLSTIPYAVVNSSDGLGQWSRMGIPNRTYQAAAFWAIDPAGGNDENTGWGATLAAADLVPLKTMAELNRRLVGASYQSTVVFHQLSTISDTGWTPLTNVSTANATGLPVWIGKKATFFSGAVATYAASVAASNTGVQMSITSIPTSWTASSLVGKMIESADGTRVAWVQKDLGTKTARLTQPCTMNVTAFAFATTSSFSVAETVNVITVPSLPAYPFGRNVQFAGIQDVNLVSTTNETDTGGANVLFGRVGLANNSMRGVPQQNGNDLDGCMFMGPFNLITGSQWATRFSGSRNSRIQIQQNCTFDVSHSSFDMQASSIEIYGGLFNAFGIECELASFDATLPVIFVGDEAQTGRPVKFNLSSKIYGTGNATFFLSTTSGTTAVLPPAATCTLTTVGSTLSVAGVSKNFVDMPYVDTTKLAAVVNL